MASINFTLRNPTLGGGKFTGTVEVSGENFDGNEYKVQKDISVDVKTEYDIPAGPCTVHLSASLVNPKKLCVDGHLQCGPFRQPTNGPTCFDL